MSRVFIALPTGQSLAEAEAYGELVPLIEERINVLNIDQVTRHLVKGLQDKRFDPENDFIVLSGQFLCTALFMGVVGQLYDTVNVLLFDSRNDTFVEARFGPKEVCHLS